MTRLPADAGPRHPARGLSLALALALCLGTAGPAAAQAPPPAAAVSAPAPAMGDAAVPASEPSAPHHAARTPEEQAEGLVGACAGGVFLGVVSAATALTAVVATAGPLAVFASSTLVMLPVVATAAVSAGAVGCGLSVASAVFSSAAVDLYRRSREAALLP